MAILVAPEQPAPIAYVYAIRNDLLARETNSPPFFTGEEWISELRVGETFYPLRATLTGRWYPAPPLGVEFSVLEAGAQFIGRGRTADDARANWCDLVHATFQRILRLRPFEMTENDKLCWAALERIVDVPQYRMATPMIVRQLGRVSRARPIPTQVAWANGRRENVTLSQMPGVFASLGVGQWFEAIVKRDAKSGRLISVADLRPVRALRSLIDIAQDDFWNSLPTTVLPESNIDWTELG